MFSKFDEAVQMVDSVDKLIQLVEFALYHAGLNSEDST